MLDTSGGAWITPAPGTLQGEDVTRRCRHAVTSVGPFVFIYGGLKGSTLLDDLLLAGTSHTPCPLDSLVESLGLGAQLTLLKAGWHGGGGCTGRQHCPLHSRLMVPVPALLCLCR